jgi:hypothetical protein
MVSACRHPKTCTEGDLIQAQAAGQGPGSQKLVAAWKEIGALRRLFGAAPTDATAGVLVCEGATARRFWLVLSRRSPGANPTTGQPLQRIPRAELAVSLVQVCSQAPPVLLPPRQFHREYSKRFQMPART